MHTFRPHGQPARVTRKYVVVGVSTTMQDAIFPYNVPGPRGQFLVGNVLHLKQQGALNFYVNAWRTFGDVTRFRMGPLNQFLVVRPDDVKRVLVTNADNYCKGTGFRKLKMLVGNGLLTSDNPVWKRQRRLMQPPFTLKAIPRFLPPMTQAVDHLLERWHGYAQSDAVIDVNQEMMRLAMDVIGRTMLSRSLDDKADKLSQAIADTFKYIGARTVTLVDIPMFVPTQENRRFRRAQQHVFAFIQELIDARRKGNDNDDLLSLLIDARDDEDNTGMTDEQLRNEVFTVYLAGHETTAQLLTWTWYMLAKHPEVERAVHDEVDAVLGGRFPTMEDVRKLSYTWMVLQEVMRLYPPAWMVTRDAIADDVLGGVRVPAGSMVLTSPYLTHRHPDYWPDPEMFRPERFTPDQVRERASCTYFPFGAGPRTCIGVHFATLEATLILAMVTQLYRVTLMPGYSVEAAADVTLRPSKPMLVRLEARQPLRMAS